MKTAFLYLLCAIIISSYGESQAQISISVGPSLGFTTPTIDYTGETTDFYNGSKYGLRTGFNYGAVGKVVFGPLNARLGFSYTTLDNSGPAETGSSGSTLEIKNNLFILSLGTEFSFSVPGSPVKPYGGIDILFSSISGTVRFQGTSKVPTGTYNILSSSRTGLGLSAGAEIKLSGRIGIDLSLRYNLINLFSKDFKTGADRLNSYTSLNDGSDPAYTPADDKHFIANDRTIATIQFQAGIMFGF